jgi:hypothetical protein
METKRKQSFVGLVFVGLVIVTAAIMGTLAIGQSVASTAPATDCEQYVIHTTNPDEATVYQVTSTRATLCVTYKFDGAGTAHFSATVAPWYQNGSQDLNVECSTRPCPSVTPSVSSIHHGAGEHVSVVYTIVSQAGTSGLFIVYHAGCDPFYLAFGSSPFSVFATAWSCGPSSGITGGLRSENWTVTGYTGIYSLSLPWK